MKNVKSNTLIELVFQTLSHNPTKRLEIYYNMVQVYDTFRGGYINPDWYKQQYTIITRFVETPTTILIEIG